MWCLLKQSENEIQNLFKGNPGFQIYIYNKMMQKEWKRICENCMRKETLKPHNKMSLCWAFYYNKIIDPNSPKLMCCIICYISLILISNPKIQTRNDLIL